MRILHVDSGLEMRGGQWQVLYLLRGLRERGHQLKLLARGELLHRAIQEGFDASPATWRVHGPADLVHAHDARSHTLAAVWGLVVHTPLVVSRRVAFPVRAGSLSRWKYSRPDRYIAISRCVAAELVAAGIKSEAISVVYDGVPLAPDCGHPKSGVVLAPASDDPMKGSDLVREAARLAGVEIRFSTNLAEDLPQAAAFVYITRSEGLGSAALLAMSRGVPVVASRVGGLTELIQDGASGLLVDNTPEDIARALHGLLSDDAARERMGRAGRAIVEQRFTLDSMVEGAVRVYEAVKFTA